MMCCFNFRQKYKWKYFIPLLVFHLKWGKLLILHYSQVSIYVESVWIEDVQIIQALVLLLVNFKFLIKQLIKKDVSLENSITGEEKTNRQS